MARPVAIVGTGQTRHCKARPDVHQGELVQEAVNIALLDADLSYEDIDAIVLTNMELFEGRALPELWCGEFAGGLGKPVMKVATGGTSGTSMNKSKRSSMGPEMRFKYSSAQTGARVHARCAFSRCPHRHGFMAPIN